LRPPAQLTTDLQRITSDIGLTVSPALSADGKLLAYSSDRSGDGNLDIWVQQIAGGLPIQRTHGPTDALTPNFSPDGASIVFKKEGSGIFIMPALAGEAKQIASSGLDPRFSPDGTHIVYWVGDVDNPAPSGKVYVCALDGGEPTQIGMEFADARCPLWAPDGKKILFQGMRSAHEEPEWWVVPIARGAAINTGIMSCLRKHNIIPIPGPGDWKGDYVAFAAHEKRSRHIWAVTLHPPEFYLDGAPEQLTFGIGIEGEPSIALNGHIAFSGSNYHNNLWRVSLKSSGAEADSLVPLSKTGAFDTHPSIAADGKKMAFLSQRSEITQVFIRDLGSGSESSLTIGKGEKSAPLISRDGSLVAYSVIENDKPSIYILATDNAQPGGARRACANCGTPSDWIPDLSGILYTSGRPQTIYRLDLASGISTPILKDPAISLDQPHISPDGRWIAFVAAISPDRARICVVPLDNAAATSSNQWIFVTDGNSWDDKPRWLDENALIYYSNRDHFGCLWKQQLKTVTRQPVGIPSAVHHFHELRRSPRTLYRGGFEIAPSQDFLVLNLAEVSADIWLTSLPRRH
jgi:Tol biopolymer transport system component